MNCRPLSNCVLFFCSCSLVVSGVFGVHWDCGALPPTHFSIQSDFVAGLSDVLLLCPVRALSEYVASTSRVVNRPRRPFVSSRCSSRVILKYRIFCLLREGILYCRQLRRCCGAHSFPDLTTSSAFFKNGLLSSFFIAPS